jgi:hypothetical protein
MSQYTGRWEPPYKRTLLRPLGETQLTNDYDLQGLVSPLAVKERPVNILRVSFSELGSGDTGTTAPNRPGWYAIKWLANMVDALNAVNGRKLAVIVYPEAIGPGDLR